MERNHRIMRKILVLSILLASFLITEQTTYALSTQDANKFYQNNILFYDPSLNCSQRSTTANSTGDDVYMIGDSITYLSQDKIKELLPNITINAQSGIWFSESQEGLVSGVDRVSEMGNQSILVFALGSNGGINEDDINKLFDAVKGKDIKIILMTIYYSGGTSSDQMNNANIVVKNVANQYDNVTYIDWYAVASANPGLVYNQEDDHVHPVDPNGTTKFAETVKSAIDKVSSVNVEANSGDGNYTAVLSAKNANQNVFNVAEYSDWSAMWGDGDTESMTKLLENYGDLAYQLGKAVGAPWIAILVQMRYEDPNSVCGANNFWGNGCDPAHAYLGGATIKSANLGEGFVNYAKTLTNGYYDEVLGISDPKTYLEKIGPIWVQGDPNGEGYASIEGMKKSVDALTEFIQSAEGQKIVSNFGNYTGSYGMRQICANDNYGGNGVTFATYNGMRIAFPIAYATKSNISGGRGSYVFLSNIPCNHEIGCHYGPGAPSGNVAAAFDICHNGDSGSKYGKCVDSTVVSITSGTITRTITTVRNGENCNHVRVLSDYNNKVIAYMHLKYEPELAERLSAGTHIEAGTIIGHVSGEGPCHDDSTPHVHIDMNINVDDGSGGGPNGEDRNPEINKLINTTYYELPEDDKELDEREAQLAGGLTESQAQALVDYYKSNAVDKDYWYLPADTKWNCVSISAFFTQKFTSAGRQDIAWGNGKDTATVIKNRFNLESGREPKPFSIFSVTAGKTMCDDGYLCGHTGVVLSVEGDDVMVIEAAYENNGYTAVVHYDKSYFVNAKHGDTFTYLAPILNRAELNAIVGG